MSINFETNVQFLKGVGPKMAAKLEKLGIKTVCDLIFNFPRRYEDYTQISKIGDLARNNNQETIRQLADKQIPNHNNQTIKVKIESISNKTTSRRRFVITEAIVSDDTGELKVVWFNQPYLAKMFSIGREIILNGKITYDYYGTGLQMESPTWVFKPEILSIYSETAGISSRYIANLVKAVNSQLPVSPSASRGGLAVSEYLPAAIVEKNNLLSISQAIENIHQPENLIFLTKSKERLAFDELFLFSLRKQLSKRKIEIENAPMMKIDENFLRDFVAKLPFKLTDAQKKSAWMIIKDLEKSRPMSRLLNGDVGSGKTVVAAFATAIVVKNGFRVVLMAPTEILANQHFKTLSQVLKPFKISVGLITSATKKSTAKNQKLKSNVLIGTHALLHLKEPIENLGLVIVDEQHRFGVDQREALIRNKRQETNSKKKGIRPHFLSMTATPIPRTMSLVIFSDLDVSVIDEMPKDRKAIETKVVLPENRQRSYDFIRSEIKKGHQAFVVCPLIDESLQLITYNLQLFEEDRRSVVKEFKKLSTEIFPDLKITMLHGKMKSKEKDQIMSDFKDKKIDILVSTSVIEVGVDIPNATVMMIESAERFGLAQLHQFRGRVGRSGKQSFCFLFSGSKSSVATKRLAFMESISSGFKLAEKDLELRGPGQMYGGEQSGFWDFQFAKISDKILIEQATSAAKKVAEDDIKKYPKLKEKLLENRVEVHLE